MKRSIKFLFFLLSIISISCELNQDNLTEEELQNITSNKNSFITNNGYIITSIVSEYHCGEGKWAYSVYASSGTKKVNYDRIVHVGIIHTSNNVNTIVDAKILTIPANETKSENKFVFQYPIGSIGDVTIRPFTVLGNNSNLTNSFQLRSTTYADVRYCYENSPIDYPCQGLEDATGSPSENNDDDNDGLCNESDPDDNNNGIPDISEEN
ncbi:hypothetical protein [Aquimarina sp. 2201CG5-10]|uniref:hypothetical protein n=1 Tax=Aquimarina callyspongiae TaxID=3098150 RepID=UPI002AB536DA|nr:hypothetical protein [Aquimarina sp. 2201CG5-10]MDY8134831.1 hypothetical protein [Aquimarina sp. 2201CG5-10]